MTCPLKNAAKMATPETFSETGSETMYEKVRPSVTRSATSYYYAPPEIELVEDQRGGLGCARGGAWARPQRPARHAPAAPSTLSPVETAGYYTQAHSRVARSRPLPEKEFGDTSTLADPGVVNELVDSRPNK